MSKATTELTGGHLKPSCTVSTFVNFVVSGLTSIRQLLIPLLPLSFF